MRLTSPNSSSKTSPSIGATSFYSGYSSLSVTGHHRDTLHTSTCFYRLRDCRNLRQFAGSLPAICRSPPHSAKFCQALRILLSSARTTTQVLRPCATYTASIGWRAYKAFQPAVHPVAGHCCYLFSLHDRVGWAWA